jgi:hypothetical protein
VAQKYPQPASARHRITLAIPATDHPPGLVLHLAGACVPDPVDVVLTAGEAYDLGRDLLEAAQGVLAGIGRPWDGAPERPPFVSRRSAGSRGQRASAPAGGPSAPRARRRASRDGYPRPRRSVRGGQQAPGS